MNEPLDTEKYRGYTIKIWTDDDAYSDPPTSWGSFTVTMSPNLRVVSNGPDWSRYVDEDDKLTIAARAMLKSGRVWPIRYSEHGLSGYNLAYDAEDADGFIEFEPDYVKGVSREDREKYARGDLQTYTDWANGSVYGFTITNLYGQEFDGSDLWGIYGFEYAHTEAKMIVDADIKHDRPAMHAVSARELHK